MGQENIEKPSALYVGVGVGIYDSPAFKPLPRALTEVKDVGRIFEGYRYEVHVIENPDSVQGRASIREKFPMNRLEHGGSLVVLWAGHGALASENKLGLVTKDSEFNETPEITPDYLAGLAARTGANQILLILDTCFSGSGVISAGAVINDVQREIPPDNSKVWIGIVASAMDYGKAKDGTFGDRLLKLLRQGPDATDPELWLRWSDKNKYVMVVDILNALLVELDVQGQSPKVMEIKNSICQMKLPNPRHIPDAPERVVEHLIFASRGVAPGEEGLNFTGRANQLARVVSWMHAGKQSVFVITGPAGSGKSAIAGRIVSLSNSLERAEIFAAGSLEHADPGEGSVHVHVQTRGVSADQVCQLIDEQLVRRGLIPKNSGGPRNQWELFGAVEKTGERLVIVIDGLDEAGEEARKIAEAIRLLATKCLLLVSSRELSPREEGGLSLIQSLGPAEIMDLGEEAIRVETERDVRVYIATRLRSVTGAMEPAKIADAIVRIAHEEGELEGIFLLARVLTSQLQREPVNTSLLGWEELLDRGIDAAFERELSGIPPLRRDDHELPYAKRELLTALAWSYGSGLPDDIWPIVASAVSPTESTYQRDDVYWLLSRAGRFVVEGVEGGRAVYRLFHQRLVEHLRPKPITLEDRAAEEEMASSIPPDLISHYLQLLEQGQPPQSHHYLWNYAWRHAADAGARGITALLELCNRSPADFLPGAADAIGILGFHYIDMGRRQEAVASSEGAVSLYRTLAEISPAFLPKLAKALNDFGSFQLIVDQRHKAMESLLESERITRNLSQADPAVLTIRAECLSKLGILCYEAGELEEGIFITEQAVIILRGLAKTNPTFFGAQFALALNNLGFLYREAGSQEKAMTTAEEAVRISRELSSNSPNRPNHPPHGIRQSRRPLPQDG